MLEEFLGRDVTAPIYGKGWVDVMIDVDRDTNGKQINDKLKGERRGGLPWMVILDADRFGIAQLHQLRAIGCDKTAV